MAEPKVTIQCPYQAGCITPNWYKEQQKDYINAVCNTRKHQTCLHYDDLQQHFTVFLPKIKSETEVREEYQRTADDIRSRGEVREIPIIGAVKKMGNVLTLQKEGVQGIFETEVVLPNIGGKITLQFQLPITMNLPLILLNKDPTEIQWIYAAVVPENRRYCACGQKLEEDFAIFSVLTNYPSICCNCRDLDIG